MNPILNLLCAAVQPPPEGACVCLHLNSICAPAFMQIRFLDGQGNSQRSQMFPGTPGYIKKVVISSLDKESLFI